jgi:precorrin-6A/cobalt-precorrin-6A reductase
VRILILAGSTEASALARHLDRLGGHDVTVSFAGRTRAPVPVPGTVRVGGFGGVDGLVDHLREQRVDALVDATHPFAARMPWNAQQAATAAAVPRLRLCRPPWAASAVHPWHDVPDLAGAAACIEELGAERVLLTTGRQALEPFARLDRVWFLVRAIEPPDPMPIADAAVLLARGPFVEAEERELMRAHQIDLLVAKNSGGDAAAAKLGAARALGIPVVMVSRPAQPSGPAAETVDDALEWIAQTECGQDSAG